MHVNKLLEDFAANYDDGADGSCPTANQWKRILERPADEPITLINFFKLRPTADYQNGEPDVSGEDAFSRYASVSMPTMERVGGKFLFVGNHQGAFLGEDEDWDIVAIGSYPNLDALVGLYADKGYQHAFHHRTAACERQKVFVCA